MLPRYVGWFVKQESSSYRSEQIADSQAMQHWTVSIACTCYDLLYLSGEHTVFVLTSCYHAASTPCRSRYILIARYICAAVIRCVRSWDPIGHLKLGLDPSMPIPNAAAIAARFHSYSANKQRAPFTQPQFFVFFEKLGHVLFCFKHS